MDKLLADESVDFRIVEHLREGGYEIEAIVEINPSISDEEVLSLANEMGLVLITEDKDFGELTYRLRKPNQGIVLIRMSGLPIEEKIGKVLIVMNSYLPELRGKFTVISKDRVRIKDQNN